MVGQRNRDRGDRVFLILTFVTYTCTFTLISALTHAVEWKKCSSSEFKLETVPGVSVETCSAKCGIRPDCYSFNYLMRGRVCELLSNDNWADEDPIPKRPCLHVLRADLKIENYYGNTDDRNAKTCPIPKKDNFDVLGNMYTVGSRIKAECHVGYRSETGNSPILCNENAHWTNFTTCTDSCLDPPIERNAEVSPGNNSLGEERNYTCLPDTILQPGEGADVTTRCLYGHTWKPTHFQCLKGDTSENYTDCGEPDPIDHAAAGPGESTENATRYYKCSRGFNTPYNTSYILTTCLDGNWTSPLIGCIKTEDNQNSKGSYLFGLLNNYKNINQGRIYIVSSHQTKVTLTTPLGSFKKTLTVSRGAEIVLSINDLVPRSTGKHPFGFLLESETPVGVYVENSFANSSDGSAIIPESHLSNEYILISWRENNAADEFAVVGTTDETKVEVTWVDGEKFKFTLDRYQQYFHKASRDITGAFISSSANVAVFAGNVCTNVLAKHCDHLYEQMPPIRDLQTEFIVSYPYPRHNYVIRIMAIEDNTEINLSNGTSLTLNRNAYSQYQFNNVAIAITTTKRVMVAAYTLGGTNRREGLYQRYGGSMLIVAGISQSKSEYSVHVPRYVALCMLMITYPTHMSSADNIRRNHQPFLAKE